MKKIAKTLLFSGLLLFTTGLAACGGGEGNKGTTVTFRLNYKKNASEDVFLEVPVKKGQCVDEPEEEPTREGYIFNGWHEDQDKDSEFDFEEPIQKSIKIYAHWLARLNCTFDLNYSGAPTANKVEVIQNQSVARPQDPTRDGYQFIGWTTNKDARTTSDEFEYFDFTYPFQKNMTLYAQWGATGSAKVYRFEAEYCEDITKGMGMGGATYSGGQRGKGLIQKDPEGVAEASNGYWVHFLYVNGNNLKFKINSDAAGNAKIDMRLSAEYKDAFSINSDGSNGASKYTIKVNNVAVDYGTIAFTDISSKQDPVYGWMKFANYPLAANLPLVQGENVVEMITDNEDILYGTAAATAPMIDCLQFETSCNLSWGNAKGSQIL
jgi:uncharacterized repeat protein (TIGR02543 family)